MEESVLCTEALLVLAPVLICWFVVSMWVDELDLPCFISTMACSMSVFFSIKIIRAGTSLVVQWFRHCDSAAEGTGSIPQWGNMTLHAVWHGQEVENKIEHSHREV